MMDSKKIINYIRGNNVFLRMLLSFIIICAFLLTMLSFLLYTDYSQSSMQDLYSVSNEMLNQTYTTVDGQLRGVYDYFYRMYEKDTFVYNALYALTFDDYEMYDINQRLNEFIKTNTLVESVYIYNKPGNIVFSNKTTAQYIEDFYDCDIINYLSTLAAPYNPSFFPRVTHYQIYEKKEDLKFLSLVYCEPVNNNAPNSALIVNINQEKLREMLLWKADADSGIRLIATRSGSIILQPEGFMDADNISTEEFFKRILHENLSSNFFTMNYKGVKRFVSYYKTNNIQGWYFISIIEYQKLVSKITNIRDKIFFITGIFILAAIFISLIFIKRLYKPLHNLLKQIKSKGLSPKLDSPMGEFDFLNETFNGLSTNIQNMKSLLNTYKPAKKKEFLQKLIQGEFTVDRDLIEQAASLGIHFHGNQYLLLVIKIDSYMELSERCSYKDMDIYRFAIANIATEVLQDYFHVEMVDSNKDFISLIIIFKDSETQMDIIKGRCREIQNFVSENFRLSTTIGIGSISNQIMDIHKSYIDALDASNHRIVLGKGALICHDDIAVEKHHEYNYPFNEERKVIDSLKLESIDGVDKNLTRFIEEIHGFTSDEIKLSLTQLALVVIKTLTGILDSTNKKPGFHSQDIFRQISACDSIDEMKNWVLELCTNIIVELQDKRGSKNREKIDKVTKYIDENYFDPNLTVEFLSEFADLSPNHLRLVFKGIIGKPLSGYITEVRLNQAEKFLRETDIPAYRISEMVGLYNTSYFYTCFKKHTGKSPEQYREKN